MLTVKQWMDQEKPSDDKEYREFALLVGLKRCACELDRLNPDELHKLDEFSEQNHFAHIAFRTAFKDTRKNDMI